MLESRFDPLERLTTLEVCEKLKVGRTKLYGMLAAGHFPKPEQDGGRNYWPRKVVDDEIRRRWNNRPGGTAAEAV